MKNQSLIERISALKNPGESFTVESKAERTQACKDIASLRKLKLLRRTVKTMKDIDGYKIYAI